MSRPVLLLLGLVLFAAGVAAQGVRARWGGSQEESLQVMGIDERGRVRLVTDGADAGEALVPIGEARGLRFELSDEYQRGRQLALDGRGGEAVLVLRRIVPALVPYAPIPESNAATVVRFYFRLLLSERAWADAVTVAMAIDPEYAGRELAAEWAVLGRGLHAARRWDELGLLLDRSWVEPPGVGAPDNRAAVESLAASLREDGRWRDAAVLVQKLREGTDGEVRQHFDLLLAYLDWHQGSDLGAQAMGRVMRAPDVSTGAGALYRLLQGRLHLQAGRVREALDVLAEALVGAGSASGWRVEITALLAEAYRENGDEETAQRIAKGLRRQHPDSRWVAGEAGEPLL